MGCFQVWAGLIVNVLMVRHVDILRPKLEDLALLQTCFGASHCGWRGGSRSEVPGRRGREGGRERAGVLWSERTECCCPQPEVRIP